eukprot:1910845-Prymnesium_polylepis.1
MTPRAPILSLRPRSTGRGSGGRTNLIACRHCWTRVRLAAFVVGVRFWYIVNSSRNLNAEGVKGEFARFTLHTCLPAGLAYPGKWVMEFA